MRNMLFRWKKMYFRYFKWTIQWKHIRWSGKLGILEYNIRKYTIKFSKELAKITNKITTDLETKLKHFEKHENYVDNIDYQVCKQQLDEIYEKKAKGIKIRSKCNWYEHGEKSTNFFLNLEKISCNPKSNLFCHC